MTKYTEDRRPKRVRVTALGPVSEVFTVGKIYDVIEWDKDNDPWCHNDKGVMCPMSGRRYQGTEWEPVSDAPRDEIALQFAVAAYGGLLSDSKVRGVRYEIVARDAFEMADAFIARRDGDQSNSCP
jgi:hypothetical protein